MRADIRKRCAVHAYGILIELVEKSVLMEAVLLEEAKFLKVLNPRRPGEQSCPGGVNNCRRCGQRGHYAWDCTAHMVGGQQGNQNQGNFPPPLKRRAVGHRMCVTAGQDDTEPIEYQECSEISLRMVIFSWNFVEMAGEGNQEENTCFVNS